MAWSIFQEGGGPGAAGTWAQDLLKAIGAPVSPGNQQFIYDWEVSEGGGGKFNPLNQGPVPGQPGLTTTGSQFGGGAADYASWQAGLQGAVDYLHMPNYKAVLSNLKANNPAAARAALWASPWAGSHYGYGSAWSNDPFPGKTSVLPITATDTSVTGGLGGLLGGGLSISGILGSVLGDMRDVLERLGLILLGGALILLGIHMLSGGNAGGQVTNITETAAPAKGKHASGAAKSAGETGAKEAVEAAAVA